MDLNNAQKLQALFYNSRVRQEEYGHPITAQIVSSDINDGVNCMQYKSRGCPCCRLVFIVNDWLERGAAYTSSSHSDFGKGGGHLPRRF